MYLLMISGNVGSGDIATLSALYLLEVGRELCIKIKKAVLEISYFSKTACMGPPGLEPGTDGL